MFLHKPSKRVKVSFLVGLFLGIIILTGNVSGAISYVRSGGSGGTSFNLDIGSEGSDRVVVVFLAYEGSEQPATQVTVDGKNCNLVTKAHNTAGTDNHQEMWFCDEDDLGSSNGVVTVAFSGGDSGWATHAHLYTGVSQSGPSDFGIDQTSASVNTVTVTGIDVPADGLVVMGASQGSRGSFNDGGWTSPLTERTDGFAPSTAILATASETESSIQTGKTYIATASVSFNRGTGIVAVWPIKPPTIFADDFENIGIGIYPSANGWSYLFNGIDAYVSDEQAHSGSKSFKLIGSSSGARVEYVPFTQPDRSSYEVYAYPTSITGANAGGFAIASGSSGPIWNAVRFWKDGTIVFDPNPPCPTDPSLIVLQTYTSGKWYKVHVDLDYTTNTGDVYIDDVLKADDVGICPRELDSPGYGHVVLNQFALSAGGYSSAGTVYYDDVVLSGAPPTTTTTSSTTTTTSTTTSTTTTTLPPPGEGRNLTLKVSGELDFERWGVMITAFVRDKETGSPVSDALVLLDIYSLENDTLWVSGEEMNETLFPGVYKWNIEGDPLLMKGLYIARVQASFGDGPVEIDMIEFHIDPPVTPNPSAFPETPYTSLYRALLFIFSHFIF
jgi:hypothetical protein